MKILLKNIILFLVGYCTYIAIEVTYRGSSYVLMGICGGLAVVIIDKINNYISWDMDILIQGIIGSVIITFFELVIGEISLKTDLLPMMWNYTNVPLNYDGVICLPFSIIWIGLSIIGIMVADAINYYVFKEFPIPYYKCFGQIIFRFIYTLLYIINIITFECF